MLRKLLGLKPNDWKIVWYDWGGWNIVHISDFGDHESDETCRFYIKYSPSRKEYKLETGGYNPKDHHMYEKAMNKLIEFQSTNHGLPNT